ncbi:uncharacterized protein PRCAT00000543001 [Priceomyces carsonii]|uniref:uncharacterized protein n=1 Tax=Priceomyces carsonii TaxID=28549 RepID=UPI002ED8D635|nr:unnamed protein product [Priceomyces carsonii]
MAGEDGSKCPVDHNSGISWKSFLWKEKPICNVDESLKSSIASPQDSQPKCPVDHNARAAWASKVSVTPVLSEGIEEECNSDRIEKSSYPSHSDVNLPTDRDVSSIPRTSSGSNWVYPSQKQFFEAMKRKNWDPEARDMKTIVPIHNAVNEMAWHQILRWERGNYEDAMKKCGGIKLTSFKGDSKKLTPRAWFKSTLLGYDKPFDRHDWKIDRCGVEIDYVIDFYGGSDQRPVHLDVRPKINSWEGLKLRLETAVGF